MNLSTEKKIIDLENRLVVAWREGEGSGMYWELGVNGCKLLLLEWISNEICCVAQRTMSRYLQRSMTVEEKIKNKIAEFPLWFSSNEPN